MATLQQVRARIAELRSALDDVRPGGYVRVGTKAADARFQRLFDRYVTQLAQVKQEAESWWQGLLASERGRVGDPVEAETNVKMRRPAGYAVNPQVVHVFREAWMECVRLGNHPALTQPVHPFELTVDWLLDTGHTDLADFVGTFPFLPIALDDAGDWV